MNVCSQAPLLKMLCKVPVSISTIRSEMEWLFCDKCTPMYLHNLAAHQTEMILMVTVY